MNPVAITQPCHRSTVNSSSLLSSLWRGLTFAAVVFAGFPVSLYASSPENASRWTASAQLFTVSQGRMHTMTRIDSLGELRGVVTVRGKGVGGGKVRARMMLRHLSWQGTRKVIMAPTVVAAMHRISTSTDSATFAASVRVPTILPIYWSVVQFTVTDGRSRVQTQSGVWVGKPAVRTRTNTLTVAGARNFCSERSRLPYLSYAVYIHGYFMGLPTGSDGPPVGIVLDRPRHVTPVVLRTRTYAHGIIIGGFGVPRHAMWSTIPGYLTCLHGRPNGFGTDL